MDKFIIFEKNTDNAERVLSQFYINILYSNGNEKYTSHQDPGHFPFYSVYLYYTKMNKITDALIFTLQLQESNSFCNIQKCY